MRHSDTVAASLTTSLLSSASKAEPASKTELRRHFRRLRKTLGTKASKQHALELQRNVLRTSILFRYQRFALYSAADGEIDTAALAAKLWELSKQIALPVLKRDFKAPANTQNKFKMHFAPYYAHSRLVRGPYNLLEPASTTANSTAQIPLALPIDILFMPLVAYDTQGSRLGMGGGFYDRYAAGKSSSAPLRVGLAHSIQKASQNLPLDPWDIPLDAVITEREVTPFNRRAATLLQVIPSTISGPNF